MLHLRLIAPPALAPRVLELLHGLDSVTNVVCLPDAALKPAGHVVFCDVAREDGSVLLLELRRMDFDEAGTIAVETVDVSVSDAAEKASQAAEGSAGDAVLWENVEAITAESAELTTTYVLFMLLATILAAIGILTDSVILVIGAMVVGPEFGPLAGVCVALVQRRARLALLSCWALAVGFAAAIVGAWAVVLVLRAAELTPGSLQRTQTMFISHPDVYSVLVALLAGIAGMVSLSTAKAGALIGVLISVTTIPAAANIAVAAAYGDNLELRGAALQLAVNLVCIVAAGTFALRTQRLAFWRRLRRRRAPEV
jgi:uncharacterized hydrophobic protein (TIGR00271 family)